MKLVLTEEETEYMYNYMYENGHKKIKALVNSGIGYNSLNKILKPQVPYEFFKTANNEDIIMFLLNKGFTNQQINQIMKGKEKNKDKYMELIDSNKSVEDMRQLRIDYL